MEIAVGSRPGASDARTVDAHVAEIIGTGVVLLAVAEGFGIIRGQPVPALALTAVRDALRRRVRPDGRDARACLISAVTAANARVFAHSGSHDDHVASGTSLTAALIVGDRAHIAHVGRTRAYLDRIEGLTVLTTDDELTGASWVTSSSNAPTEALNGCVLTRTLGTQPALDASISNVLLLAGDSLILATPGFHRAITDDEIAAALRTTESSETVTHRLLEMGKRRGTQFVGTIIVGRALTTAPAPLDPGRGFNLRTAAVALATLVVASLLAATLAHAFLVF